MNRVIVTKQMVNIYTMQVCGEVDVTDDEILKVCNRENPSGTIHGWTTVCRRDSEVPQREPIECGEHSTRMHFLVTC